jgi:antitoxin MazE
MHTKIQKWGNSLGLRIPKAMAEEAGVKAGSDVELVVDRGRLVIRPAQPAFRLEDLLSKITRKNLHEPVSTGDAVGREVW